MSKDLYGQLGLTSEETRVYSIIISNLVRTIDEIVNTSLENLAEFVIEKSKNKIKDPHACAKQIAYIARESYRIDQVMHDSINYALISSYNHIKFLKNELKMIDKEIESYVKIFNNQYQILVSIKGIGPVIAAGIIAELGDVDLFDSHKEIAKYAGLIWRLKSSGHFVSKETALTKAGNRFLRFYLVQAAQSLSYHNSDFKVYYQKKLAEATKYKHKRAILFLARNKMILE